MEADTEVEMATSPVDQPRRKRLGDRLVEAGVIREDQRELVLASALPRERFGTAVLRLGLASEAQIADALADQLGLARTDLENERIDPVAIARLPERIATQHMVLPLRLVDDHTLIVATADPTDVIALDDVLIAAAVRSVRPVVTTLHALTLAHRRVYRKDLTQDILAELDDEFEVDEVLPEDAAEEQPVILLVDSLISDAVSARASDIHIEPGAEGLTVRIRVDGLLREMTRVPRRLAGQVLSRVKIMARLDIAERRLPQDGRAVARVDGQAFDLRVSTMPTMHGETIVLRVLPKGGSRVTIDDLGLTDRACHQLLEVMARPQGLVLVTGPTGSGKTSTLYAGIDALADPTRNVLTLEDPVEVQLPGVNQTQIEPKIGLTFARGLRHVLRQDPDVVLVGEIRDQETAQLAVEAAFTGHLVLATLHTNDAPSAIARLVDLGADRFLIASSLLLVLAQRLARKVCDSCAVPDEADPEVMRRLGIDESDLAGATLRRGEGCATCEGSGTHGRLAVSEALAVTPTLRDLITDGASETMLARAAQLEGLTALREDAIARACNGVITLDEALRMTPEPSTDVARCPGCAEPVADDHVVCPWCSTALAAHHCKGCGRAVEIAWPTCPWCREKLLDIPPTAAHATAR